MLRAILQVIHGTATKLKNAKTITIQGAVNGKATFDGSKNITINTTQDNVAILSGSIEAEASSSQGTFDGEGSKKIPYPAGFTKDNCRIISISTCLPVQGFYSTGSIPNKFNAADVQRGMFPIYATRRDEDLMVVTYNPLTQKGNINYEIVLMKI